jgi:hypothetical protein
MTPTCVFAWASIRANRRWVASAMSASVFTAPWVLLKGAAVDLPLRRALLSLGRSIRLGCVKAITGAC